MALITEAEVKAYKKKWLKKMKGEVVNKEFTRTSKTLRDVASMYYQRA